MFDIKTVNYITADEIQLKTGIHFSDLEWFEMAENDSYVCVNCSDEAFEELNEDIDWEIKKGYSIRLPKLLNMREVLGILREDCLITDEILIYVSW